MNRSPGGQGSGGTERPDDEAGRSATVPRQIPLAGWKQIIARVLRRVSSDNLGMVAAGVAFYSLLALFPGIAALISIYGLWPIPRR